jgi:hypothetical protein
VRPFGRIRGVLGSTLLLAFMLVRELRDLGYTVLLVSVGVGMIVNDFRPGSAWGAGMVVFGALSLLLRSKVAEE